MSVVFLDQNNLGAFVERVQAIPADARPKWGRMTPAQMFRHLRLFVEMSLGEREDEDISNVFTRTVLRWLFFHVFTRWPRGRIRAPEEFTPSPEHDAEGELAALVEAMERFVAEAEQAPTRRTRSPLLGPITLAYWGRVHGIHFDHHLRQFGV